ncbi:unnamed protein product [Adineta steineri]|uniref:CID domain-containing protein n=1 Tax=Adineta steineri TaxID=433720 RepID=A0A814GGR9_9BILA|nr:unnamed protein product [Adineta steineri]
MEPRARSSNSSSHDGLAPNSMKSLTESKLRAFEQGTVAVNSRANLSRKEREEIRAKIEANETEEALKEFVAAFEEPVHKTNKTFVKGGVFNPGSHEETPSDRGKTYRTTTTFTKKDDVTSNKDVLQQQIAKSNAAALAAAAALSAAAAENKPKLKNEREKRKSNLESFKEELKRIQEERDRRHSQKSREKDHKPQRFLPPPSISQHSDGDSITSWRTETFRLFKDGSLWLPPQPQQFTSGMPDEVFEKVKKETENEIIVKPEITIPVINPNNNNNNTSNKRGRLSHRQRDHLEDLLRTLTPERNKIGEAMLWAIDHAEAADEIIDCITESLSILQTAPYKKISRLYLISDILHNCSVKVTNASHYRRGFETRLPDIFQEIHQAWSVIDGRLRAEQFKQKVMSSFRAWESWAIYPSDYLIKLQNIFLGLVRQKSTIENEIKKSKFDDDIDGKPIHMDSSSDNRPLALVADYDDEEDIDGKPISMPSSSVDHDIDGRPIHATTKESRPRFQEEVEENSSSEIKPRFVPTKWQSIDPSQVAAQAVTISKWDFDQESTIKGNESLYEDLAETSKDNNHTNNDEYIRNNSSTSTYSIENPIATDSLSTSDISEERRQKLRDVEIQVLKYADELESGRRERSIGLSLVEEIEAYRQNLLKKIEDETTDSSKSTNRTSTKQSNESSSSSSSRNPSSRYSQQRSVDEKST